MKFLKLYSTHTATPNTNDASTLCVKHMCFVRILPVHSNLPSDPTYAKMWLVCQASTRRNKQSPLILGSTSTGEASLANQATS